MSGPVTTKPRCRNCGQPYFRHRWMKEECIAKPGSFYEPLTDETETAPKGAA